MHSAKGRELWQTYIIKQTERAGLLDERDGMSQYLHFVTMSVGQLSSCRMLKIAHANGTAHCPHKLDTYWATSTGHFQGDISYPLIWTRY